MKLTNEQTAVVDAFRAGGNLVVQAGAGAGKSSTLVEAARAVRGKQGRYLTFNSANAYEARTKFPEFVKCSTIHGQAWHIGREYAERGRVPLGRKGRPARVRRQYAWQVAEILGITGEVMCDGVPILPSTLGALAMKTVNQWCLGVDPQITVDHVPRQKTLSDDGNAHLASEVVPLAAKAWRDVCDLDNGRLNVQHDHYLRMWWDSGRAWMKTDFIMLDEAQDTNGLAAAIIQRQTHAQLVAVGDSSQSIYEWRGAIDALETWPASKVLYLTQSFRFGDAVADWANMALDLLGAQMRLSGTPSIGSTAGPHSAPRAVLCRTNAGAVKAAVDALNAGRRPALASGGGEIKDFAEAAAQLMDGRRTAHQDLFAFSNWEAVRAFAESEDGEDLAMLVGLVDDHGTDGLVKLVDGLSNERHADVTMSTAHGSKGLEWDSVGIGDDFPSPGYDRNGNRKGVKRPAGRLAYVALTRARHHLDPRGLSWVREWFADPSVPRRRRPALRRPALGRPA